MKITNEHYQVIKQALAELPKDKVLEHAQNVKNAGKFKDFGLRMRWDLLWASKIGKGDNSFMMDTIYPYANDEHIDTALKTAVKELGYQFN